MCFCYPHGNVSAWKALPVAIGGVIPDWNRPISADFRLLFEAHAVATVEICAAVTAHVGERGVFRGDTEVPVGVIAVVRSTDFAIHA